MSELMRQQNARECVVSEINFAKKKDEIVSDIRKQLKIIENTSPDEIVLQMLEIGKLLDVKIYEIQKMHCDQINNIFPHIENSDKQTNK